MRNIVIVECVSTGINFIQDIVNNKYNPIVLETRIEDDESFDFYRDFRISCYDKINYDFEMIEEEDSYEKTLEKVREYDPLLVIPGSERGVILATKLASDLNLPGNPIENLDAMTLKDKMQERLKEKGVRHIRGKAIHSVEEAIEYYDSENLKEVVIKPTYGSWSVGVRICTDREQMISSLNEMFGESNIYGEKISEFVIQERINGEEYIVNTVSSNGSHRVTLIWKYNKIKTSEGGHIYDSCVSINEIGLGESRLVEYAYDVADAIGIKYGAVHGEYMIDENGPVLIEVNCRPCGATMPIEFLDRISGQHETDSILDSYLEPGKFNYKKSRGYKLRAHGALKFIIVPEDMVAESSPIHYIVKNLQSHFKTSFGTIERSKPFVKTQDLETAGGTIYMVHEYGCLVQKELEFLRNIEKHAFQLVLSNRINNKTEIVENESYDEVKSLINIIGDFGTNLFVTDDIFDDVNTLQVEPGRVSQINGEFDSVVINLNRSIVNRRDDYVTDLFLKLIGKVKVGGLIFIPETTYQYAPNGRVGIEALIKVLGLKLEIPLDEVRNVIIASK